MNRQIVALAALFLLLAACGSDDTTETDMGNPDASVSDSGEMGDGGNTTPNGTTPNATTPDSGQPDAGAPDADVADSGSDAAGGEDGGTPDASTDGPCAAGFTHVGGIEGVIAACDQGSETLNQCDTAEACGDGWGLCTATEFRANYEATEPPGVLESTFWLASCIRDGDAPISPTDQICSDCTGTVTSSEEPVAGSCVNSIQIVSEQAYVGVRAAGSCQFVGAQEPGDDAYWSAAPASAMQAGAYCCPD